MNRTPRICAKPVVHQAGLGPQQPGKQVGAWRAWVAAVLLSAAGTAGAFTREQPVEPPVATRSASVVALSALPVQGQDVYQRILAGGPFRYDKDGTVFGNREQLLPRQRRGFYREYTVPTPGSRDRGARRIVCGGEMVKRPETCYYTKDHYQSFQKIDPLR